MSSVMIKIKAESSRHTCGKDLALLEVTDSVTAAEAELTMSSDKNCGTTTALICKVVNFHKKLYCGKTFIVMDRIHFAEPCTEEMRAVFPNFKGKFDNFNDTN
jgi:hypothetical protein